MEQRAHLNLAHRKSMQAIDAFVEIMNGPNPLTAQEIRAMAVRRPAWAQFLPYADRMDKAVRSAHVSHAVGDGCRPKGAYAMSIRVFTSAATPTLTGVEGALDVDVTIEIDGLEYDGEVTLVRDPYDGQWRAYGPTPDYWVSGGLLRDLPAWKAERARRMAQQASRAPCRLAVASSGSQTPKTVPTDPVRV